MRLLLPNQRATEGNKDFSPFAQDRCCICGKKVTDSAAWLLCCRDSSGQEYAISGPGERVGEMYVVPVGPDCMRRHPELKGATIRGTAK